jgi:hypothetical protein
MSGYPQLDANILIYEARAIANATARSFGINVTSNALLAVDELVQRQLPAMQQAAVHGTFDLDAWKTGVERRAQEVATSLTSRGIRSVTTKQGILDEIREEWLVYPCK